MNNYEKLKTVLKSIARKPRKIYFDIILSDFMGYIMNDSDNKSDNEGAILLNQLIFWSDKTSHDPDGFFHKTYAEWQNEIRLSKYKVYTRTEKLIELGIVETKRETHPFRNCTQKSYKFHVDKFITHFALWVTETMDLTPKQREKFDEGTSAILRRNVSHLTKERPQPDAPQRDASLESHEYYTDENMHLNTITPPAPPMNQLQPHEGGNENVITPTNTEVNNSVITQRMQWLDKLDIQSNEIRYKISNDQTWNDEQILEAIAHRNDYLQSGMIPPDGALYAAYFQRKLTKNGKPIILWPCPKPKIETPQNFGLSPDLMANIMASCEPKITKCVEWEAVKIDLQQTMTNAGYTTTIHPLECQKELDGSFTLRGPKNAIEVAQERLRNTIARTFKSVTRQDVSLNFEVAIAHAKNEVLQDL